MQQLIQNRVFIIHGFKSSPTDCWFPWLKTELEKRHITVHVPRFTHTENPKLEEWLEIINKEVGAPDENTYFIGHSLGAIAIIRYLENVKNKKIGGVVFVAGRVLFHKRKTHHITGFFEKPIQWRHIQKVTRETVAIYSIDDPFVSTENGRLFEQKLGSKLIIERNKGHFATDDEIFKLPIVLRSILSVMK